MSLVSIIKESSIKGNEHLQLFHAPSSLNQYQQPKPGDALAHYIKASVAILGHNAYNGLP